MEKAALDVFLPVMESAVVIASNYARACGRDTVLAQDMCYGLMFSARYVTGKHVGSFFPEIYEQHIVTGKQIGRASCRERV